MITKIEASRQMTDAWVQMIQSSALGPYLELNDQELEEVKRASRERLQNKFGQIPGIFYIAAYLKALNSFLT